MNPKDERVMLDADDVLELLTLIGENIEDLSDDEQELLNRCEQALGQDAPVTVADYQRRIDEQHRFVTTLITGGLLDLGPAPEQNDG